MCCGLFSSGGLKAAAAVTGTIAGTYAGTLFAPSLTLAAGGTTMVMGATITGLGIAFFPAVLLSSLGDCFSGMPGAKLMFNTLAVAAAVVGIWVGASMIGLGLSTVLPSVALGACITGLGALAGYGLASICLDGLTECCSAVSYFCFG